MQKKSGPQAAFTDLDITADMVQHFAVITHTADQILLYRHITYLLMQSVDSGQDAGWWTVPS